LEEVDAVIDTLRDSASTFLVNFWEDDGGSSAGMDQNLVAATDGAAYIDEDLFQEGMWSVIAMAFVQDGRFGCDGDVFELRDVKEHDTERGRAWK
jgi:hypothetical protein